MLHIYGPGGDAFPDQDPNWVHQTGTDEGQEGGTAGSIWLLVL